ncbi:DUF2516 family protein [Streptomyces polyrhachis]|uniref:DUF2516 family protein n=1 Tax=Streptomyces polyrhachis TaxID=1282885 RepID=A0ABW2GL44_9ACTN
MLLQSFGTVLYYLSLAIALFSLTAFVDAALKRKDAYEAAGKQNKGFWLIILGIGVAVNFFPGMFFLVIIGLIADIVYFVDVRPALKQVAGPRRRGGSSSDGPYGPFGGR